MRTNYLILFIAMMAVTYIPRVIPFYLYENIKIPKLIDKPLKLLPCAAIGAFIFPSGITLYPNQLHMAPIALGLAALVTWASNKIPLGVFVSILSVLLLSLIQ